MKNFLPGLICGILIGIGILIGYFIGELLLHMFQKNGAILLAKDVAGARIGLPILGGLFGFFLFVSIARENDF